MSSAEVTEPPRKKRRFFTDDPPEEEALGNLPPLDPDAYPYRVPRPSSNTPILDDSANPLQTESKNGEQNSYKPESNGESSFDKQLFESFVGGTVSDETIQKLREVAGDNMERAINMYMDGTWKTQPAVSHLHPAPTGCLTATSPESLSHGRQHSSPGIAEVAKPSMSPELLQAMPEYRYIGAFGVGGWATRSGPDILKHGETVRVERTKIRPTTKTGRGGKQIQPTSAKMRTDIIVRFTNAKGEEIGRLPKDTAAWVSPLMDQKVCRFDGICVYAPERIRINDTIYLQLCCSMLRRGFEAGGFVKPENNNRTTGIFEEKETSEEKELRLRQVSLVKLFEEINLQPSTINETTAKHKRQGILQAAEIAEQYDTEKESKSKQNQDGLSSPASDEEAEEGKELEQDQLDTLYKKAQSFDFNTPCKDPPESFIMDLRKYQRQALHWMVDKEKDEKSEKPERSMHPLWEEYQWPTKDVDDKDLPMVAEQESFYINPYSGELSLDFPAQEQHCLGGILADGKSSRLPSFCKAKLTLLVRNGSWQNN